jgi:CRP-like cAMP-binding protein
VRPRRALAAARLLRRAPLFAAVPVHALEELADGAEIRAVPAGRRVVAELEPGEEALIVLRGTAVATAGGLGGEAPITLGDVRAGDCIGEMALFTGELRSATVTATRRMILLVIDRERFERLLRQHPSVAAHLAAVLARRLQANEHVLATLLDPASSRVERERAWQASAGAAPGTRPRRLGAAVRLAWRELVVRHRQELPFLMLVAFATALAVVRAAILVERRIWPDAIGLEPLLRASYVTGLLLLCGSGGASLLYFRPALRRLLAVLFGVGLALLFNALPVLLTFDLFFRDMVTRDPNLTFSIDVLYDRAEGANAVVLAGALLFQAVYLRRFYRRLMLLLVAPRAGRSGAVDLAGQVARETLGADRGRGAGVAPR